MRDMAHSICLSKLYQIKIRKIFDFLFLTTLSTVISFLYKDKLWFDESMSVIFCMENTFKRILLFPLHINLSLN